MEDDFNPYAAAPIPSDDAEVLDNSPSYYVQGDHLVARSGAVLPDRCVITNEPTLARDRFRRKLDATPSFTFVVRRVQCELTFSVLRRVRWRNLGLHLLSVVVLGGVATFFCGWGILFWFIVPLVAMYRALPIALKARPAQDGWFYISGCGEPFLQSLRPSGTTAER